MQSFLSKIENRELSRAIESLAIEFFESSTPHDISRFLDSVPTEQRLAHLEVILELQVGEFLDADHDPERRLCYGELRKEIPDIGKELDLIYPLLVYRELCLPEFIDANKRFSIQRHYTGGAHAKAALARDLQEHKDVFVKFEDIRYDNRVRTLKREWERLKKAEHQNVVHVVESFATADQFSYFVIEHLPFNLRDVIPLSPEKAASIGKELCDALLKMEDLKIDHGDIKPENIGLTDQQRPKLFDMGLSSDLDNGPWPSKPKDNGVGTQFYSTPEALGVKQLAISPASEDRFALAISLIELISPIHLRETLLQRLTLDSKWVEQRRVLLTDQLEQDINPLSLLLKKEISSDPGHRCRSTKEFKHRLEKAEALLRVQSKHSLSGRQLAVLAGCLTSILFFAFVTVISVRGSKSIDGISPTQRPTVSLTDNDPMTQELATQILERVQRTHDGASQGQSKAIPFLIAAGWEFQNSDFSGVNLSQTDLSNGNFHSADLRLCKIVNTDQHHVILAEARMEFADLSHSVFVESDFRLVYAPFAVAKEAVFRESDLTRANFIFANLEGADFTNADLTGAALTFCDLRGAKFTHANLTNTSFNSSVLDGADFSKARFKKTSMTAVSVSDDTKISIRQLNNVVHRPMEQPTVEVMEFWESQKYSSGWEFKQISPSTYPITDEPRMEKHMFASLPHLENTESARGFDPDRLDLHLPRKAVDGTRSRNEVIQRIKSKIKWLNRHIKIENFLVRPSVGQLR